MFIVSVSDVRSIDKGRAICSLTITTPAGLSIHGARLMDGQYGPWLAPPSAKDEDTGEWVQIVEIDKDARKRITASVLDDPEVRQLMDRQKAGAF